MYVWCLQYNRRMQFSDDILLAIMAIVEDFSDEYPCHKNSGLGYILGIYTADGSLDISLRQQ